MGVPVKDDIGIRSRIQVTALEVPDELDDHATLMACALDLPGMTERIGDRISAMQAALAEQFAQGKMTPSERLIRDAAIPEKARKLECMQAIRRGEIPGTQVVDQNLDDNLILRGFWEDLFARLASGNSAGANQSLKIQYLALGKSYADSSFTQGDLTSEYYRDVPDETYDDGVSTYYTTLYVKKTEANPTGSTTVSSATTNTITVASATDFVNDGRIQITTASATYNCTISISGTTFTCSAITGGSLTNASAFDPLDPPVATNTVVSLISEGGCIIGEDATSTPNSGKAMNRRLLETLKNTSRSLIFDYILAGASLP